MARPQCDKTLVSVKSDVVIEVNQMGVNHTIYDGGHSCLVWIRNWATNVESVLYFCNANCTDKNAFNPLMLGPKIWKSKGWMACCGHPH